LFFVSAKLLAEYYININNELPLRKPLVNLMLPCRFQLKILDEIPSEEAFEQLFYYFDEIILMKCNKIIKSKSY